MLTLKRRTLQRKNTYCGKMRESHDGNQARKHFRKLGEVTNFKCCTEMGGKKKEAWQIRKKVTWDPNRGRLGGAVRQDQITITRNVTRGGEPETARVEFFLKKSKKGRRETKRIKKG